ncbi:carboxylesterase family protein [Algoriphagus aestuariicola]|uniref:Carboxylic ester hydrolase n=1 Tax=Algoriphagus aestuariicola TaxID=1852016 RepID=A0ABS3BV33_9BACT|nr:carboxylesterase family protein [Algoriphagus aestuariicola]MBN7803158.1 carboxylesterase family protein [Algoriphagus aestuariicola]
MKKYLKAAVFFLFGTSLAFSQSDNSLPVQTTIENGTIEGNYDVTNGISTYFGIPFAKPPVGELRWKAPVPAASWSGVKETKDFGPRPVQGLVFGDMNSWSDGVSEDCLTLNVWTPAKRSSKDLPVLVYFYGGGFVAGDASEPRYNGESMAKKGIVVVTVNYRLGVFGFLAHPELSAEASYKASGNYGLLDQSLALQWVKDNIAAFGGNPNQVTIAGESAGSISVSYQMASPLSKNLIHGAIGESGAGIRPTLAPVSLSEAENTGEDFLTKAGVNSIADARKLSAKDLLEIYQESQRFGFPVVIDHYFLPKTLPEIFAAGEQAQVPLLLGWNSAEIPGAAFMQGQPSSKNAFIAKVKQVYPEQWEEVLALYPHDTPQDVEWAATNLASDRFISYSTWKWFDLHRNHSEQPVYRYLYSKIRPDLVDRTRVSGLAGGTQSADTAPPVPKPIGAPHAAEIEYAMGNLHLVKDYAWTKDDFQTSETFLNFFTNFVKTGNPNGEGVPSWSAAKAGNQTPPVMIIDTESKEVKSESDARYLYHDRYYKNEK